MSTPYTVMYINGHTANNIYVFVVDEATDMAAIDTTQLLPGSRVFVIDESKWYMLKHSGTWAPITWFSGDGDNI